MSAYIAQEFLAMLSQQSIKLQSVSFFEGCIYSYDAKTNTVFVQIEPEDIILGPMPYASPWAGNGFGMQVGPTTGGVPNGQEVYILVLDAKQSRFLAVASSFNSVDLVPTLNSVQGAPEGEFWLVHKQAGTYIRLGNDNSLHLGGDQKIEAIANLVALGDKASNLSSSNGVVRNSDLQTLINYINQTLVPALSAIVGAVPPSPAATASNIVQVK